LTASFDQAVKDYLAAVDNGLSKPGKTECWWISAISYETPAVAAELHKERHYRRKAQRSRIEARLFWEGADEAYRSYRRVDAGRGLWRNSGHDSNGCCPICKRSLLEPPLLNRPPVTDWVLNEVVVVSAKAEGPTGTSSIDEDIDFGIAFFDVPEGGPSALAETTTTSFSTQSVTGGAVPGRGGSRRDRYR